MNKVKLILSANIKKARKQKELSQDELARLADIPYNTLVKIESGKSNNPTFETLLKLSNALEVSIDELAGRKRGVL
ncbi:MAG: helix-turn-helix transcriptional regulator [Candidatus Omnitrophica bacterium]|nr:helix-turn-helix transcriptional regulator [Candidatus Omnitrophota bacterium]